MNLKNFELTEIERIIIIGTKIMRTKKAMIIIEIMGTTTLVILDGIETRINEIITQEIFQGINKM